MPIIQAVVVFCAIIAQSIVTAASTAHDIHSAPGVIDSPRFTVPTRLYNGSIERRDAPEPPIQCDWTQGIAYVRATSANIGHLKDVKNTKCVAAPRSCTRVAFLDNSGIFLCNDNEEVISPICGDLIAHTQQLFKACRFANFYTFGVFEGMIESGTEKVPYHLRIAGEGW